VAEPVVTPSELRDLVERARLLAADMVAARQSLHRAEDQPIRKVEWRLDDAAGEVQRAGEEIAQTAHDLEFIIAVRGRPHCRADWGCCPDHGGTLASAGGRCWCRVPGCGREWDWRRMSLPCDEAPAFRLVDARGGEIEVRAGHAVAAHEQVEGGRPLPLQVAGNEPELQVGDRVAYAGREADDRGLGRVEVGSQGTVTGTTPGFDGTQVLLVDWDGGAVGAYGRVEVRLIGRAPSGEEAGR
jgi:hypothetical protein